MVILPVAEASMEHEVFFYIWIVFDVNVIPDFGSLLSQKKNVS